MGLRCFRHNRHVSLAFSQAKGRTRLDRKCPRQARARLRRRPGSAGRACSVSRGLGPGTARGCKQQLTTGLSRQPGGPCRAGEKKPKSRDPESRPRTVDTGVAVSFVSSTPSSQLPSSPRLASPLAGQTPAAIPRSPFNPDWETWEKCP